MREAYRRGLGRTLNHARLVMIAYAGIVALLAFLFIRLPTGFLPAEDQGFVISLITLPAGATQDRTMAVANQVADYFLKTEKNNVDFTFTVAGLSASPARARMPASPSAT